MQSPDWPAELERARQRLLGATRVTPLRGAGEIDRKVGAHVLCKDEGAQLTGSFKLRGAWNAVAALGAETTRTGVITYSSGNFGAALAYTARRHRVPCVVVTAADTPQEKLGRMREQGAELLLQRPGDDRVALARLHADARGMALIPPYDDIRVIAGQASVGRELLDQAPELDALVVPVSGGGLLAGCALAARASAHPAPVFGVEPAARPKTHLSLRNGRPKTVSPKPTIADALRVTRPGQLTFPIIARLAEDVLLVEDEAIAYAMAVAHRHLGVRCEPGGAAALAAALGGQLPRAARRIGVVLSGSNIDAPRFRQIAGTRLGGAMAQ